MIFVIDSSDKLRFSIVENEIEVLMSYANIKVQLCTNVEPPLTHSFFCEQMRLDGRGECLILHQQPEVDLDCGPTMVLDKFQYEDW